MSEPKPIASLGPLLLARKGTAKPAMRAQLDASARGHASDMDELANSQNDLGWNDMGHDEAPASEPEVRIQQTKLVHRIADSNLIAFTGAKNQNQPAPRRKAKEQGRRAAFTLRLDDERHLKLKLASTVSGESAQQLVTKALDEFLSQMPEIETLAAQVSRKDSKA